jgi:prefoldin subunit 5
MDTTNDQDQYLWYNWSDRTIEIDWDAIDKIVDGDVYKHVKDLISEAEEIQGKMDDAEDAIADIKNQIQELENIWRDTYVDFEKRVLDAVVKSYQEVIDDYGELNDTLTKTNQEILDAIQ